MIYQKREGLMNLLSEIISKPVLNLYTGKIEGTVKNAYFDNAYKKIQYFKIFDDDEEEYLLDCTKIFSVGKTCLVIKNGEALTIVVEELFKENNPINLNIYTTSGERLGRLNDVEFNDTFEVTNYKFLNANLLPSSIINIGENIIVNTSEKKLKHSDFKPKIRTMKSSSISSIVKILPVENASFNQNNTNENLTSFIQTPLPFKQISEPTFTPLLEKNYTPPTDTISSLNLKEKDLKENDATNFKTEQVPNGAIMGSDKPQEGLKYKISNQPMPQKVVGNGSFLIGRKALKTIYGINNEIIIKKDNIINSKNLESAKKHSKLVELTVFSKIKN